MSRKYRQRGYQEDDRPSERKRPRTVRSDRDGPRGRGLGAPTATKFKCARCGRAVPLAVAGDSVCSDCGADLHTCTNCRHFDSSAANECREPIEQRVKTKAERNDCSRFAPKRVKDFAQESASSASDAKAAFDALFDL